MNRFTAALALLMLASSTIAGAQAKNPCTFLTKAEIESVLGVKLTGLTTPGEIGSIHQSGVTQTCSGVAANRMSVMVMYVTSNQKPPADPMAYLEAESRKAAQSIGAQMEVKRAGSVLCTALIPPKQGPYATQCMVPKLPSSMASITVMVATRPEMVSIDKLLPLAQKMVGRF